MITNSTSEANSENSTSASNLIFSTDKYRKCSLVWYIIYMIVSVLTGDIVNSSKIPDAGVSLMKGLNKFLNQQKKNVNKSINFIKR